MDGVRLSSAEAFKQMYREQLGFVLATLQRLGAPTAQVEDLCHDVFMAAFRKRDDYDPERPLKPWLFGFAYRLMLNVRRKAPIAGDDAAFATLADRTAGPEELISRGEAKTELARAIEGLEPDRRAVFLLHDVEGEAAPEIARVLEIPLNTAYSRLRLARADVMKATVRFREGTP